MKLTELQDLLLQLPQVHGAEIEGEEPTRLRIDARCDDDIEYIIACCLMFDLQPRRGSDSRALIIEDV